MLCPTFNITKISDSLFGCVANFSELACNKSVHITLEAWLDNSILLKNGPKGTVFVNCSETRADNELFDSNRDLSEAVFSILETVGPLVSKNDQGMNAFC